MHSAFENRNLGFVCLKWRWIKKCLKVTNRFVCEWYLLILAHDTAPYLEQGCGGNIFAQRILTRHGIEPSTESLPYLAQEVDVT